MLIRCCITHLVHIKENSKLGTLIVHCHSSIDSVYSASPCQGSIPNKIMLLLYAGKSITSKRSNKLTCIIHYFKTIIETTPNGVITFQRRVLHVPPNWGKSTMHFTNLVVDYQGTIETNGHGMLQVSSSLSLTLSLPLPPSNGQPHIK